MLCAATAVPAQTSAVTPCRVDQVLAGVPADYEALIIINDAKRQRLSSAGRSLAALVDELEIAPNTLQAWRNLAAVLDWTGDQAFDELLGRKAALVIRRLDGPGDPEWALVTEVSIDTERRLIQRLKAAPRGRLHGLAVLAVEDGRYELVIGRAQPGVDTQLLGVPPPTAAVLLGPGGDNALLAELAPSLVTRTGLAAPAPVWRAGQKEQACDVIVMLRRTAPGEVGPGVSPGPTPGTVSRFLTLTATLEEGGWDAHLACSPDLLWSRPAAVPEIRPWSDGPFRDLERDALFAWMGLPGSGGWTPPLPGVDALADLLAALKPTSAGQLAAITIRPARDRGGRSEPLVSRSPEETRLLAADEREAPAADSTPLGRGPGALAVTVALESADPARTVNEGDRAMVGLLAFLRGVDVTNLAGLHLPILGEGVSPNVVRRFPVAELLAGGEHAGAVTRWFGEDAVLAWGGRAAPAQASSRLATRRWWWVASLAPEGRDWGDRDSRALSGPSSGKMARRLSLGLVRPAALAAQLGEYAGGVRWARWIDLLRWDAALAENHTVEARVRIRMVRPPR